MFFVGVLRVEKLSRIDQPRRLDRAEVFTFSRKRRVPDPFPKQVDELGQRGYAVAFCKL